MNHTNWWRRTNSIEINLAELLKSLCRRWWQALVCAVVFALLLGLAGNLNTGDTTVEEADLTVEEQRNLDSAVALDQGIEQAKKYLGESVYMNIDPYNENRVVLLYCVEGVKPQTKQLLVESYLNYLNEGAANETVKQKHPDEWDMAVNYMNELVRASSGDKEEIEIVDNSSERAGVVSVTILGSDADMAQRLAEAIKEALTEYHEELKGSVTQHKFELLSETASVQADSELAGKKRDKNLAVTADLTSLQNYKNNFTEAQMELYELRTGKETEEENPTVRLVKFAILGFVMGGILFCGGYICLYTLSRTLKCEKDFSDNYTIPYFGKLLLSKKEKKGEEKLQRDLDILARKLKMSCNQENIRAVMLTTDFLLSDRETEVLTDLQDRLKKENITVELGEDFLNRPAGWERLLETGTVCTLFKTNATKHSSIDREMAFLENYKLPVLGAVILEVR